MREQLVQPLQYYESELGQKHAQNVHDYFQELVKKSGVNEEENRATVKEYNQQTEAAETLGKKVSKYRGLRTLLIVLCIIGLIVAISGVFQFEQSVLAGALMLVGGLAVSGVCGYFWFAKLNPIIKNTSAVKEEHLQKAAALLQQATEQMAPLNALFRGNDTLRLIEKTVPVFRFHNLYSKAHEQLLLTHCDFVDILDGNNSVTDTLAGTFCNNPFLYSRYNVHTMGTQTYEGSLHIQWVETYRDSQGSVRTRNRSETLYASVTKPKPSYSSSVMLGYGCQAAPELCFSRGPGHIESKSEKEIKRIIRDGEKRLQKKAREATRNGGTFQEMANSEFDVLFGAVDRDHETQFRLLFTPLAQTNITSLLKSKIGFGDDFSFIKHRRYNVIMSEHSKNWVPNTTAEVYYSYDIDAARNQFCDFNNAYFRSLYFDFAPLMSVPAYVEEPAYSMEPIDNNSSAFTYYEYEALANAIGTENFAHEASATDVILKTTFLAKQGNTDLVNVTAYSYSANERIDYVPVRGGDGNYHNVPVPWIEYLPVERTTPIELRATGYNNSQEFLAHPEETANIKTPWAFFHGILANIR